MEKRTDEDVIRIRVLPEEVNEVAEWAGLMLGELVGHDDSTNGEPVAFRDPERAAELMELLMLCSEEGADASAALEPIVSKLELVSAEQAPDSSSFLSDFSAFSTPPPFDSAYSPYASEVEACSEKMPIYRDEQEREEVLMAVRYGASALLDLARSHGMNVPDRLR
ncbi:hypothetical protein [Saccharibacillus sp. JS10]|uniref:hypothetical protein n=1 Tax=Saccharibacillus sp. JS10 TaxID=2950552 RepID=UPI00210DBDBE|nr:hypothetical protein [Saccharibacillus sp. JS10]MCQ4087962.1 hypothetical protein [Saccharibacillus sp. JS10]